MSGSPLPPADIPAVQAPADAPDADNRTVRDELATPYTLDRFKADLRALAQGTPTGFDALDELGMRWLPGKVYTVIARPGAGKTALMLEAVLRYLEKRPNEIAVFLSWEEPLADLVLRLLSREDAQRARRQGSFEGKPIFRSTARAWGRGELLAMKEEEDFTGRLDAAGARLSKVLQRLHLIDGDALGRDAHAVLREAAAWMRDRPEHAPRVGLVAVDYFQKLRVGGGYLSRQVELQAASDLLRRFAKGATLSGNSNDADHPDPTYAVPLLVGAQVSRESIRDGSKHPTGDQIREADDLLNDATAVIALSWESTAGGTEHDEARSLRMSVSKHRGGRARPDEFAKVLWHPARDWLDAGALRDSTDLDTNDIARIRWTRITDDEPAPSNGKAKTANGPSRRSEQDYR